MISRSYKRNGWRRSDLALLIAVPILAIVATWSVWTDIFRIANYSGQQSHIFLVPLVAAWLIWVRRGRFNTTTRTGLWFGPLLVAAGWGAILIGPPLDFESLVHGGAVMMFAGAVFSVIGVDAMRQFFPAFGVLIFLVPVPGFIRDTIVDPVQLFAIELPLRLVQWLGMDVVTAGELIIVNGQAIAAPDLAKGMIMLFTVLLVAVAFAYGMPLRGRVRVLVVATTPIAVVALNVVRMIPTVWLIGRAGPEFALLIHVISGWLIVAIAMLLLLGIIRVLRRLMVPVTTFVLAYD